MSYTERLVQSPLVVCTWEQHTDERHEQRIVPDACVDLIWTGTALAIAGPDTGARLATLSPATRIVGVRLRPGAAGAVLEMPTSELRDISADAADVLGHDVTARLLEALAAGCDPHAWLLRAVQQQGGREPDPLVSAAIRALAHPRARVASVANEVGLSSRQLQRRISDAVGYGPKTLQRVLRFRRLQSLPPAPLAELAFDAGYSDQAHMTAEVRELAGLTPVRFLTERTPTAA